MDKRINSGSGCYGTVVAATPAAAAKQHYQKLSIKPKQQQQQQHQLINTVTRTVRGNSSPKLAATFQGMSVNVVQSASGGIHSWPIGRQEEKPLHPTAAAAAAAARSAKQQQHNNNNAAKLQKLPQSTSLPVMEQQQQQQQQQQHAVIRTKPRNKSEEAIGDLLQRIPDIGRIFDVHSRIGNGTFSTVLLATLKRESHLPDSMRRKFAIKHHIPTSHPDRIMKELQCMTDMGGTDNVVGIHCCLRCEASAAFVMPYMPHDRFHDFYTKMDVPEIRMYMRNLLLALRHVHKFNIIHRDVKPSNFLYNRRQGQFLLVDFGLAQHVVNTGTAQTGSSAMAATGTGTAPVDAKKANPAGASIMLNNSKRPRERDSMVGNPQQAAVGTAGGASGVSGVSGPRGPVESGTGTDATLGGAVKRMRLIEETTSNSWNKMPLKPINEITQSTKPDDTKQGGDAQPPPLPPPPPTLPAAGQAQAEQTGAATTSSSKYNTNRTGAGATGAAGGNGKCFCFANPTVCLNCLMKKEVHASRAGTPGYRPPEVLLKYADQTTAVDVWAAGVIFLSILSSVYPFFKAPNDFVALAEIVTIFGDRAIRKTALALDRMVTISHRSKSLNLRKLCLRFRHRLIFSDAQMIRKYETPDGRCDVCKNCDQYFFNCLCEDSDYVTEPLDPYECFPASAYDLLGRLLEINPHDRISAEEALKHPFFSETPELAPPAAPATAAAVTSARKVARRKGGAAGGVAAGGVAVVGAQQAHSAQNKL